MADSDLENFFRWAMAILFLVGLFCAYNFRKHYTFRYMLFACIMFCGVIYYSIESSDDRYAVYVRK
jgi:hypothetical protein